MGEYVLNYALLHQTMPYYAMWALIVGIYFERYADTSAFYSHVPWFARNIMTSALTLVMVLFPGEIVLCWQWDNLAVWLYGFPFKQPTYFDIGIVSLWVCMVGGAGIVATHPEIYRMRVPSDPVFR